MKRLFQLILLLAPVVLLAQSRPGSISGRIVTANGAPAVGVRVAAITAPQSTATGSAVTRITSLAPTDADGRYRLEDISPGRYLISAGALDSPTYYPGVFTTEKATIVNVSAGGSLTGIDFKLPPNVSGRLQSSRQDRAGRVFMELAGAGGNVRLPTTSSDDGSFRFDAVPPGTYSLTVHDRPLAQPLTLNVNDRDITGLKIGLLESLPVSGSLVVEGGGLLPRITVSFVPLQGRLCSWLPAGCFVPAPVATSGGISTWLVEGDFHVTLSALPAGYFLKSIVSAGVDLDTRPFHAEWPAQPILITLGVVSPPPWVKVSGRLRDEAPSSSIAKPYTLSLLPARGAVSPLTQFIGSLNATVTADGAFEFPMVPPGAYEINPGKLPVPVIPLMVTDKDIDNVDIVVPSLKEIAGRFSIDGLVGPPTDPPLLTFALRNPAMAETVFVTAPTRCDGRFRAVFPQGNFSVTVTGSGFPAKSLTYGSTDLLQSPMKIIASGDRELLRVVLPKGTGSRFGELQEICDTFLANLVEQFSTSGPILLPLAPLPPLTPPTAMAAPDCLSCPSPNYPPLARAAAVSDTVLLSVIIGKDGTIREASVVSGHILLRDAAVDAVKQWRYNPHLVNGEPVEVQTAVTVTFK